MVRHVERGIARTVVVLAATLVATCAGGAAALAAPVRSVVPAYLFSIPSASGSLTGRDDHHLTLRLRGAREYLTRFTDRPLRDAAVVANVDFARRFAGYFASSKPNAVLTYTPRGSRIPVSIVLTIGAPRWSARRATWTFPATRIRKRATDGITPPLIRNPRGFSGATLMIDDGGPLTFTWRGCTIEAGAQCPGADLSLAPTGAANLSNLVFSGMNLAGANLAGDHLLNSYLVGTDLAGADLAGVDLTGAHLHGADLAGANLTGANLQLTDLSDADFTGATLHDADLSGFGCGGDPQPAVVNATGANFTDADFTGACIFHIDFSGANFTGADFTGFHGAFEDFRFDDATIFCHTTLGPGMVDDAGC